MKASEQAFVIAFIEAFELVAQDEAENMSIVQEIMLRSTDYLRRIIAPVGQGGVTMSHLCPHCNSFPLEDYVWRVSGENPQSGGAEVVEKSTTGSNRTGFWSYKQGTVLIRPRSSKRMRTSRPVRKLDQCVEIAGEPARRWRWPLTEYCAESV